MTTFLKAYWQQLIMANYEIDPSYLVPYLPKNVELDYFHGKTYVSLVGFLFKNTSIFNVPVPFIGTFEEVNLRFYVIRKVANQTRRGVVFINETVPNVATAWLANKLYKEHYSSVQTNHKWNITKNIKEIQYAWKVQSRWNSIEVNALTEKQQIEIGSIEEFIFEHYYGYTKVNSLMSMEYKIEHPRWELNPINSFNIDCDFAAFYGNTFEVLNNSKPSSVMLAEGSKVKVDWNRTRF